MVPVVVGPALVELVVGLTVVLLAPVVASPVLAEPMVPPTLPPLVAVVAPPAPLVVFSGWAGSLQPTRDTADAKEIKVARRPTPAIFIDINY
jgi:hypothetical protein